VIKHTDGNVTDINIGSRQEGCDYFHSMKDDVLYQDDLQALQFGKQKQRLPCTVPFQLGKRAYDSLDLISELPKQGLQQFCRKYS
jgi:hypothetical protein